MFKQSSRVKNVILGKHNHLSYECNKIILHKQNSANVTIDRARAQISVSLLLHLLCIISTVVDKECTIRRTRIICRNSWTHYWGKLIFPLYLVFKSNGYQKGIGRVKIIKIWVWKIQAQESHTNRIPWHDTE